MLGLLGSALFSIKEIIRDFFSYDWKYARVTPLFQQGDRGDVNTYRPISVIPIVGKGFETSLRRRANARNVSTSLLPYGGITYFINSVDYPNFFRFNSAPTQHQFL